MEFSDYVIYVDESGDHSLSSIDSGFPVFALDFCIFAKEHYYNTVVPRIQQFKFEHFGHDTVVLHEHDIRKQKRPFVFLQNETRRAAFMEGLNAIIEVASFTIIAAVINKRQLTQRYVHPDNPYEIALRFCMERAYTFLKERGQHERQTHVVVERRGKREDDELELAFRRIRDGDNWLGKMPGFDIVFAEKRVNSAGLQLADLTARPIALHALRPIQPNRAFDLIKPKLRRAPNGVTWDGWGLKVFP